MRALRLHRPGDLRLEDIPVPTGAAGTVLVTVEACGVCGSDLHFIDGTARTARVPITLGHEIAGIAEGRRVVVEVGEGCGVCPRCREDRPNLCERPEVIGIDVDGGLADQVAVARSRLVPVPDGVSAAAAATAVDAGATAFHAVTRTAGVRSGETVLVIGIGGLGGYAVQMAASRGARVIAADIDEGALQRAGSLGAEETVLVGEGSLGRSVKALTGGGVDAALEFVGRAATVDAAVKSLRPGGRAVVVGVGIEPVVTVPPVLWSNHEYALRGSYGSLPGDTARVLAGLADGTLQPPPIVTVPLADAVSAMTDPDRIARGGSRLVVVP